MSDVAKVGQIWQDNDKRNRAPRFVRVTAVNETHARCEAWYEEAGATSRTVRIRLDRFKPTSYRLVEGPGSTSPEPGPAYAQPDENGPGYPCEGAEFGICDGEYHVPDCPSFPAEPGPTKDSTDE